MEWHQNPIDNSHSQAMEEQLAAPTSSMIDSAVTTPPADYGYTFPYGYAADDVYYMQDQYPAQQPQQQQQPPSSPQDVPIVMMNVPAEWAPVYDVYYYVPQHVPSMDVICNNCGLAFRSMTDLEYHYCQIEVQSHQHQVYESKQQFHHQPSSNVLKKDNTDTDHRVFMCNHCDEVFSTQAAMLEHIEAVKEVRPFPCDQCPKRFRQRAHLDKHLKVHSDFKKYQCDVCGKRFRRKDNLQSHQRIHTKEMPFECDICGKKFRHQSAWSNHAVIHSDARDFKCSICGAAFNRKISLKRHIKKKHNGVTVIAK